MGTGVASVDRYRYGLFAGTNPVFYPNPDPSYGKKYYFEPKNFVLVPVLSSFKTA